MGIVVRRFESGQSVWVTPCASGAWLVEDEAIVLDDLDTGYIVLQHEELVPSHGMGHYVQDIEVRAW